MSTVSLLSLPTFHEDDYNDEDDNDDDEGDEGVDEDDEDDENDHLFHDGYEEEDGKDDVFEDKDDDHDDQGMMAKTKMMRRRMGTNAMVTEMIRMVLDNALYKKW